MGGGSAIDTAKAVNLLTTNPGDLMDYINAPVGRGRRAHRSRCKPLVAVPTTTGTGSESTTMCVLDVLALQVKTGISHPRLRPTLAVVDPRLTDDPAGRGDRRVPAWTSSATRWRAGPRARTLVRPQAAGAAGALLRGQPDRGHVGGEGDGAAGRRVPARGPRTATTRRRASDMALAATFAGMGFGNAGVHIPHANAYPIAGRVRDFHPDGYPADEPMVPHGMAVALTAPEAFRFTFDAAPERHLRAAELLGADRLERRPDDQRDLLPTVLTDLMRDIGIPNGIGAVGYGEGDVDDLVEGALKQQRLLATAPAAGHRRGPRRRSSPGRFSCGERRRRRPAPGSGSPRSTTPPSPGRCTPPTRRSTGCRRRWWSGPGTSTSSLATVSVPPRPAPR